MPSSIATSLHRPATLKELAARSDSLESFGFNLRDWQHEISRLVTSHQALQQRIQEAPPILASRFEGGKIADAYLAAYAEWLANKANLPTPLWARRKSRILANPWYSCSNHASLENSTPDSFKKAVSSPCPKTSTTQNLAVRAYPPKANGKEQTPANA